MPTAQEPSALLNKKYSRNPFVIIHTHAAVSVMDHFNYESLYAGFG